MHVFTTTIRIANYNADYILLLKDQELNDLINSKTDQIIKPAGRQAILSNLQNVTPTLPAAEGRTLMIY